MLFYSSPDDSPIACLGSFAPADCELGVLPELVEKNGMYLYKGLLNTCFGLDLQNPVSISLSPCIFYTS